MPRYLTGSFVALALAVAVGAPAPDAMQSRSPAPWITAWATSQQTLGTTTMANATVRLIARVTIGGDAVRIRLDNTYGTSPLRIGSAYVGQRVQGASLAKGSNQRALFGGSATATIPAGGSLVSDGIPMRVLAGQDLAVSLYVPDGDVRPSQHTGALVTSYYSQNGSGDATAEETRTPFTGTTTAMWWLKAVDVRTSTGEGAIVAFGDSITDGSCSTLDASNRWEDWLAVRIDLDARRRGGLRKAVINEGIGGNTITREGLQPPPDSTPGIERLDRDVLSHHGVTDVILFMGTNDIRRGASSAQLISGMENIVKRVKARSMRIHGATIIPRHNAAPSATNPGWTSAKTAVRNEVNQWIRTRAPLDGVIDFDRAVRDPDSPDLIHAPFNCDDIHPSARGYYEMGFAVPLDLFRR
jgi:lysophospholipase L1-like esterase